MGKTNSASQPAPKRADGGGERHFMMDKPKIVCIAGPTACGKTTFGIQLAKKYNGEIVSADSMQIYRGMTIGTAAPTAAEMDGVPHHMVGVADPGENWSVARFAEAADECVRDILARKRLPVLVGGSGLYLDAAAAGRSFAPGSTGGAVRAALQERLRAEGVGPLLEELREVDPEAAARLHPSDEKRILRALEVYRESGKTITQHNRETQAQPRRYAPVYIGLAFREREDMRRRIDLRVDQMVADGLLEEVRALVEAGVPRDGTALQAIGYKELLPVVDGERALGEAAEEIKLRSRQYAKRQLTWLRRNSDIRWIYWEKEQDFARALQIATEILTAQGIQ